ncbi:MAG: hypothetical protein KBA53_02675 [Thermoclostridium sp.]|nr:hypothetical protein [Thermoclostridium sp.]
MASYPYYQPPPWKAKQSPTAPMPRATNKPPSARPDANQKPAAETIESPGEGELSLGSSIESMIENSEIGRESLQIQLNREDLLKGLIYSELLAPPKSRRMGR